MGLQQLPRRGLRLGLRLGPDLAQHPVTRNLSQVPDSAAPSLIARWLMAIGSEATAGIT